MANARESGHAVDIRYLATRHSLRPHFFTVFAGAFGGAPAVFFAGFSASASAAVLMSSINLVTRAALLPRSLSK